MSRRIFCVSAWEAWLYRLPERIFETMRLTRGLDLIAGGLDLLL